MLIGRLLAAWLHTVQRALGLPIGSPGGLWAAITSGTRAGLHVIANAPGGDRALFRLAELHSHFAELGRLDQLALVMRVVAGEAPETADSLVELRAGLRATAELLRRGRGPRRAPVEAIPVVP